MNSTRQHIHFVTGKLAAHAVRTQVEEVARRFDFDFSIDVLPITVAALMTPAWLLRHLSIPQQATRLMVPGYLKNGLADIQSAVAVPVDCGPRDIRDLPMFFGAKRERPNGYGDYDIEIIAEINHANRMPQDDVISIAQQLVGDGANVIDLGCSPSERWQEIGHVVRRLRERNIRVSVDSFDAWEVAAACAAGAELVLSVNSGNRAAATEWNAEVVVIPDVPGDKKSFEETIDFLVTQDISFRLDPILEPLACGFTASLQRYIDCRRQYPNAKMMMGIGNLTELTDVDSAGINTLLLGICQELGIQSVLTTQVINWARSSVRECDLARRMLHYACTERIPPKHIEPQLVLLRDERVNEYSIEVLQTLAQEVRDKNIRIFNSEGQIHAVSAGVHVRSSEPFAAMEQLLASPVGPSINREHAFYLGFEMAKAMTANQLGKQYEQDQGLNWGFLTREEGHQRLRNK